MDFIFTPASPDHCRRERCKAHKLKKSQWWKQQIGGGVCHYCKGKFAKEKLTMDHKVPVTRGGTTSKKNVVVSCRDCNSRKRYHMPVELTMAGTPLVSGEPRQNF